MIEESITPKDNYLEDEVFDIASNVQLIRENKGITQQQLSECLGYKSSSFISRLELWEIEKLDHEQVENIASCLNIDVTELLKSLETMNSHLNKQDQIDIIEKEYNYDNPLYKVAFSKPTIIALISVLAISTILLGLIYGLFAFIPLGILTFIFYKGFTYQRKKMIEYNKDKVRNTT